MNSYADLTTLKSAAYLSVTGTDKDVYLRQLLEDAARIIDGECKRHFYCYEGTKYMDGADGKLYFPDDVLSITSLKTDPDGDYDYDYTLTENTDFILKPLNGYPKLYAEKGVLASYDFAPKVPRGIEITGAFGYGDGESATPYSNSGVTNNGAISNITATTFTASNGTLLAIGQTIRINDEQMYITGISDNTITVKRGVNGTTAATHLTGQTIYNYQYPQPIVEACLTIAMISWNQHKNPGSKKIGNQITGEYEITTFMPESVKQRLHRGGYVKAVMGFA